jgi:hypothetical protein
MVRASRHESRDVAGQRLFILFLSYHIIVGTTKAKLSPLYLELGQQRNPERNMESSFSLAAS